MELEPEIEEGNIEYKQCFHNVLNDRLEEYVSQMLWRVGEGNGEAIYYLGIKDNGKIYYWSDEEKIYTIKTLRKIVKKANLKIVKINKIYYETNNYLKVIIRPKQQILPEKRILLLGPTGSGKTTFLANIILSQIDNENNEARMYLFVHKHEFIEKKTSSFNYNYLIHNNIKYVFIEAPGYNKYYKTRNKIISAFDDTIDCCIFVDKKDEIWDKKNEYVEYLKKLKIPYFNLNLYNYDDEIIFPNYNGQKLINKDEFFNKLPVKIIQKSSKTEFVILQSFVNNNVILLGILKKGTLSENKKYYFHYNKKYCEVIIKTIFLDDKPINKVVGPRTISISIENNIKLKNYKGIITDSPII